MTDKYPLGNKLTEDNYKSVRNLALKLKYDDFKNATGFGRGIHNRTRRFTTLQEYKDYTEANAVKYGSKKKEKGSKQVTVKEVYEKLEIIEKKVDELKSIVTKWFEIDIQQY